MCGWNCGDEKPGHKHYCVLIRENGKLLGRLCPDGTAVNRKLYAAILSHKRASEIAQEINDNPPFSGITAKVVSA